MQSICLVSLVGLPAVGKSTFCQHLIQMELLPFNILHLCYDNYVKFSLENPTQYKEQRENLLQTLKKIIENFKDFKNLSTELNFLRDFYRDQGKQDLVILCDDNHYYVSMRYKLYQLAREYTLSYSQIYFATNLEVALQRNNLRCKAKKIPDEVILEMSKRLEIPNKLVNKWEENTLTLKNFELNKENIQFVIDFILQSFDTKVQPLPIVVNKFVTPQSLVHDLDLLLRKRINCLMCSSVVANKRLLAKNLNDKRKVLLNEFQLELSKKEFEHDLDLNKYVEKLNEDFSK